MKKIYFVAPILTQAVIYIKTLIVFKVCGSFTVTGTEHVTRAPQGPIIFAPNHSSEWDGILTRVALPFFSRRFSPMYYVAMQKNEYRDSGWRNYIYGGFIFKLVGAYPRYSGKKDYEHSLQNHIAILQKGRNVCIFPEGRRTKDGTLGEAHGGVAFLAEKTNAIIIPVGITGLVGFSVGKLLRGKVHVKLHFGQPLRLHEVMKPGETYKVAASRIMEKVATLIVR